MLERICFSKFKIVLQRKDMNEGGLLKERKVRVGKRETIASLKNFIHF